MDIASLVISVVSDGLDAASQSLQNLGQNAANAQGKVDKFNKNMEGLRNAALGVGAVLTGVLYTSAKAAMDFESAMADVKKVVDFDTPDGLKKMSDDLLEMSTRIPIAADGLAQIAAAAGQSGIAANEITRFTEAAAKMGTAFDISAEEAGTAMAEMRVAFGFTQDEVETLADKINYLGNTTPNAASKITQVVQRIGSLGKISGVSADQIAAMAASITSLEPEVVSTGLKNMMVRMTAGASATKSMRGAWHELGFTAEEVAAGMQRDSKAMIDAVLKAVNAMPKEEQTAYINTIFGSEALPVVAQLATNTELLTTNLNAMGDASKYAGSMQAEFDARSKTTANQLKLLSQNVNVAQIALGSALLPAINDIAKAVIPVIQSFAQWADKNPELVQQILLITGAVTGFVLAVSGIGIVASSFLAMVTPVGMVVAALTALVGIGVALYQNWDMVKAKADEVWGGIVKLINDNQVAFVALSAVFASIVIGLVAVNAQAIASVAVFTAMRVTTLAYNAVLAVTNGIMAAWAGAKFIAMLAMTGAKVAANTVIFIAHNAMLIAMKGAMLAWTATMAVGKFLALGAVVAANTAKIVIQSTALGIAKVAMLAWGAAAKIAAVGANLLGVGIKFMLGPIGIAITVIGLLVTAGVYLYKNWDTVKAKATQVWSTVKTVIINSLKDLPAKLIKMGQDAVQGLINGIKSKIAGVKSAASELGQAAWGGVKSFLQIRSPSRKMAELGKHTADGLAKGIKDNKKKPVSEAQKMAEQAVKAVKDAIANLKKEIALFGNDDPLAEINYDVSVGKYGGVAAQDLNQMKALTATAHAIKEAKALADKFKESLKGIQDSIKGSVSTELEKWATALYDANNELSKLEGGKKLELLNEAANLDYSNLSKEMAKSNLEIDRQLELMGARTDLDKELLKIGYDLTDTMAQYSYYLETGQEARYKELESLAMIRAEREKGLAVMKAQQSAGDAFNGMTDSMQSESPMGKLIAERDKRLEILDEARALEVISAQQHADTLLAIDQAYMDGKRDLLLNQSQDLFSGLSGLAKSFAGEQSGVYRALFAIEKGFAIAQAAIAIQQSVAKAMAVGFPANIPLIGQAIAQGGQIMSSIKSVSMPVGQAHDGIMSVPKSGTWNLEKGERVLPAHTAKAMDKKLEQGGGTTVNIYNNAAGVEVEQKINNDGSIDVKIEKRIQQSWNNLANPNSHESKMLGRNVQAPRRR